MRLLSTKEEVKLTEQMTRFNEVIDQYTNNEELLKERLASLELALEDRDWTQLSSDTNSEFSRGGLDRINQLARLYWLKNPLIKRAVAVQTGYIFGKGLEISSSNDEVNEVIQDFLDDSKNKSELTSHQNRGIKETELQLFGNIFFVFFVDRFKGITRVRTIPMDQIREIICNPEDQKEVWFYKRTYKGKDQNEKTVYYKDWNAPKSVNINGTIQDEVIYHVKVNCLSDMKFGVSEVYAAIDWAKAYKEFLEDWATIVKAYSRFAWNLTTKNKTGVQRAKAKLNTTLTSENREYNPPPVTGSIFTSTENTKLEPIKTSGATTSAEDGNKMVHMVSAATGIYYHYLIGDPSTGNLATAKAMEKPMEMMFKSRQELWKDVYTNIINFVLQNSMAASQGKLKGKKDKDIDGNIIYVYQDELELNISFPDLFEKDAEATIRAIISAATLDGKSFAGTMEPKTAARMLLAALGEHDVDEMLEQLFPDGQMPEPEEVVEEAMIEVKNFLSKLEAKLDKIK